MKTLLRQLLKEARQRIPPGYRWPLVGMAGLVTLLFIAISMVSPSAVPLPVTPPPSEAPWPSQTTNNPIIELFSPGARLSAAQRHQSEAVEQIDNILLNSYLLVKCKKMKPNEYSDTWQMLLVYAQVKKLAKNIHEADALVRQRAAATQGSYAMVYGRLSCGDVDTERMAYQIDVWRRNTRLSPIREKK